MRAVALLVAGALVAFGCGGDDGDDGDDGLSKSEYIAKADGICRQADDELSKEIQKYFEGFAKQPTTEEIARFGTEVAIPRLEEVVADLRDLPAPDGDEAKLTEIYDKLDVAVAAIKRDPAQIAGREAPPAFAEPNRLAREYGFKVCGEA